MVSNDGPSIESHEPRATRVWRSGCDPSLCHRSMSRWLPRLEQDELKQTCVNINNSRGDPYTEPCLHSTELSLLSLCASS